MVTVEKDHLIDTNVDQGTVRRVGQTTKLTQNVLKNDTVFPCSHVPCGPIRSCFPFAPFPLPRPVPPPSPWAHSLVTSTLIWRLWFLRYLFTYYVTWPTVSLIMGRGKGLLLRCGSNWNLKHFSSLWRWTCNGCVTYPWTSYTIKLQTQSANC